jgi:hypothetical protein
VNFDTTLGAIAAQAAPPNHQIKRSPGRATTRRRTASHHCHCRSHSRSRNSTEGCLHHRHSLAKPRRRLLQPVGHFCRTGEQIGVPLLPRPCRMGQIGVGHTIDRARSPPHRRPCLSLGALWRRPRGAVEARANG